MILRTLWIGMALSALLVISGCRSTSAYQPTCCRPAVVGAAPACCPTPVTSAAPIPVPAAAPCCNNPPGGSVVPVPSAGYGH